ncbi:D-erythronate dehydrogenase [Paenalcaligenes suwonensis]|uniref:D-erythronate dehydrogenase n=1 Tax=Paenalcaligenes suwonensis TaxID=1202713 RepID=UPI00140D4D23|nr:D-erythronate dehydrogenase [Paenalcaligenes suwonensis]NHC60882.1 SDR family oxidoreductase [Paenalcaligenes suwonensis]
MRIAIIGAAGMIGFKLANHLLQHGLAANSPIQSMQLYDVCPTLPMPLASDRYQYHCIDFSSPQAAEKIVRDRPDLIIHLAAIVSGEAEKDFDKGYAINLAGSHQLFEAIRHAHQHDGYYPRMVFASSIAVVGAPLPFPIPDEFHLTPLTSYGTQKAITELLLADYSRRGFMDGVGIRLPTICVRPGKPNAAASGFFSSIIREPLNGQTAILPVDPSVRHWHASPRSAVNFFLHAATMDTTPLGARRSLFMPGVSVTVDEQIQALRRIAGDEATRLIQYQPNPDIQKMVTGWAPGFDAKRALALGFSAEQNFDEIIQQYIDDEMRAGA